MYLRHIKYVTKYTFILKKYKDTCLTLKVIMWKKVAFEGIRITFSHLQHIINKLLYIYSEEKVIDHLQIMAVLYSIYLNVNNLNVGFLLFLVPQVCFWDNAETGIIIIAAGPFSIDVNVLMQNMEGKWRVPLLLKTGAHGN